MARADDQSRRGGEVWELARRQHGVVSRQQLLELGYTAEAIEWRLERGRLHRVWPNSYAVGRPELEPEGRWMAAVLASGASAVLSHESAAALWALRADRADLVEVSVPGGRRRRLAGIAAHRRANLRPEDVTAQHGIPVTTPAATIVDVAPRLDRAGIEALLNEADRRDLLTPPMLRAFLDEIPARPGRGAVRRTLDRRTFTFTRSELERRFLPIATEAGLPSPKTRVRLNGYEVDFYFEEAGLVVETDGLRYHRTPAQQARDRLRDQCHAAAGLTPLRFTHDQIRHERDHVRRTLVAVAQPSLRPYWRS
jgi:very-short-patch-repair endonuclease